MISDLGDFTGLVSVVGVETDSIIDSVQIYDTAGDDVWTAAEDYGVFQMQNAYTVTATDVTAMHGYASAGGNDRAYLYGNERTNKVKTFDNDTNLVRLYLGGVYHRAKFFDSVEIDGLGGVDTAILYGTPSDEPVHRNQGRRQLHPARTAEGSTIPTRASSWSPPEADQAATAPS